MPWWYRDTPSLRGLRMGGPYLSSNRGHTLRQVFALTQGYMGETSHLTEAELSDLIAFLHTL